MVHLKKISDMDGAQKYDTKITILAGANDEKEMKADNSTEWG